MALPNRTNFFATGLVPVTNTTDACPVCIEKPMQTSVKLPCDHVFCKDCIFTWLGQPNTNSCAMCRTPLYSIDPPQRVMDNPLNRPRSGETVRAYHASGLADNYWVTGEPSDDDTVVPYTRLETFGGRMPFQHTLLRSSAAAAVHFVSRRNVINSGAGPTRISRGNIAVSIITVSNLLSGLADQQARPYGAAGWVAWNALAEGVYQIFSASHGMEFDALVLPGTVMRQLQTNFAGQMDSAVGNFFNDETRRADLDMLVGFAVYEARNRTTVMELNVSSR